MTTIAASYPLVFSPLLTSLDSIEITVEVRISYKSVKVIIPLSENDCDTYRFLESGNSNILQEFIHSVAKVWLSENMSYKCEVIDFQVNSVIDFNECRLTRADDLRSAYELPLPSSELIRYNLHTVDIVEEDGTPSYTLQYLCDDADWAHAVIHFHHGRHLGCDVNLNNKRYYPGIENDYPNARIIPPMRRETREDIMGLR